MGQSLSERKARDLRDRLRSIDRKTTAAITQLLIFNQATNNYYTIRQLTGALRANQKCGKESHW